jgi:ribosomal protein S18 acetylase RimI-like enzyme
MPKLSITIATAQDIHPLVRMRTDVARDMETRFGKGEWALEPTESDVRKQIRASRVLVAKVGDEIAGTVRLVTAQPALFDASAFTPVDNAVYVLGLGVAPNYQGQGIGTRLMEFAKNLVPLWPADALWLDSYDNEAGAAAYYRARGFREVGRVMSKGMPLIYLEWLKPV